MTWSDVLPDALGYLAALAVFATFCMKSMMTLRVIAVVSNIAFLSYALLVGLTPIIVLHGALLPVNIARLIQMQRTAWKAERAVNQRRGFGWVADAGRDRVIRAGEMLFRRGDVANAMYVIREGAIEIPEIGVRLGPGELFGEIGLFASDGRRTAGAMAVKRTVVSEVTARQLHQLHYSNPGFAYALTRLITARLLDPPRPGGGVDDKAGPAPDAGPHPSSHHSTGAQPAASAARRG